MLSDTSHRVGLALELIQQGDYQQASTLLAGHVRTHAHDASAHRALGRLASATGRRSEAIDHLRTAVHLAPGNALYQCELGRLLAPAGQLADALEHFQRTAALAPGYVDGWFFLGVTLARLGRSSEALPALRQARTLNQSSPEILRALADAEFDAGRPEDALSLWQELARNNPDDVTARLRLGETLSRLGEHQDAIETYRTALETQPESADLWQAFAQANEDDGNRETAINAYEHAHKLRPEWAFPLSGLLSLQRATAPAELIERALTLLKQPLPDADRALVGFELGKALDSRGEYEQAIAHWHEANAARRRICGPLDRAQLKERIESIVATSGPERASPSGCSDERPIFVVGMPRSGTTLTEQIIASHPDAFGCGELPYIPLIASRISMHMRPDAALLQSEAEQYLRSASRHAPAGTTRLVDKAPLNFFHIGLVSKLFPNARVIWCRRDPRDIALSIYSENFALEATFATALADIGHFINAQERLMRHWQSTSPLPILELHYEEMASDPEAHARRLIEFAGLPWSSACLDFHRSTKGVQTPSRWQVREPVHTRSVARWRRYERHLGPLIDALDSKPA